MQKWWNIVKTLIIIWQNIVGFNVEKHWNVMETFGADILAHTRSQKFEDNFSEIPFYVVLYFYRRSFRSEFVD